MAGRQDTAMCKWVELEEPDYSVCTPLRTCLSHDYNINLKVNKKLFKNGKNKVLLLCHHLLHQD